MHRSGTSLLARLLNVAGVELGAPEQLAAAAEDNPRGFWEHLGLREVQDELLRAFGGSWLHPPALPEGWLQDPRVEPLRVRAQEILATDFAGLPLWGFKDPRTSLLVDFWRPLLPGRVVWLLCVRHPLEVADSLQRRNRIPALIAEELWFEYTRSALRGTSPEERIIVHYDRLLEDPAGEIARVLEQARLTAPVGDGALETRLRQETSGELRHHRRTLEEVEAGSSLRSATRTLYLSLHRGEEPSLHETWLAAGEAGELYVRMRAECADRLEELDRSRRALISLEASFHQERLDSTEWKREALQLRHECQLHQRRAEFRLGESLRQLLRSLRGRPGRPKGA